MAAIADDGCQRIPQDDRYTASRGSLENDNHYRSRERVDTERRAGSNTECLAAIGAHGRGAKATDARRFERTRIADNRGRKRWPKS